MRLLYRSPTGDIRLTDDLYSNLPRYAILSHRWGSEEVSLQELNNGTGLDKGGYHKIRFCCKQASRDGLSHFWVDTCCIDKTNSVELQTAINSMFRWYRDADKCYVYLDDVSCPTAQPEALGSLPPAKRRRINTANSYDTQLKEFPWQAEFRQSLWFTRGWTLQELLAPALVEFYSRGGTLLGTKSSLEQSIRDVTRIPVKALRNNCLSDFSVSDRFFWMDHRKTMREEDKAYALLGILDVQIPLIYGEGREKAFRRLRREVDQNINPPFLPVVEGATFDSYGEEHEVRCHLGTRVELLDRIARWAEDPDGKTIFWLNRMAGTGKSTISHTIAQRFHDRGLLSTSFFFKKGEARRGHATRLFTTLASQLAKRASCFMRQIQTAIEDDPELPTKSLGDQFEKLILSGLRDARDQRTFVIVIDALDECDRETDIKAIISLLSQASKLQSVRLKTFLTSRPELPPRLGFKSIQGNYEDLVLHEMPKPIISRDLRVFFEFELSKIRENYNTDSYEDEQLPADWPGQYIEVLVDMATPLFIFATCRVASSELDQLGQTYLPVLRQIILGKSDTQKKDLLHRFQNIVGAVILLAEPLSPLTLSKLLGIPLATIQGQLQTLHSVLVIPKRADAPIRTFHLSFRDFLLDPSKKGINEFWISEPATHERLAGRCIELLSSKNTLKKDICSLWKPGVPLSEVDRRTIDQLLPPEAQYACLYWVNHLELARVLVQDSHPAYKFLKTHFLHWLEALCLLGKIHDSIGMVEALRKLQQQALTSFFGMQIGLF
ncbi:HET-domain-containing protein [Thozetella sp. PMI_491]|nr:HET-domain-containing protein [Thozetella sp. PMI_491]